MLSLLQLPRASLMLIILMSIICFYSFLLPTLAAAVDRIEDFQAPPVSSRQKGRQPLAPALYLFGDSLLDTGNNNLLPTQAKANFLPYGHDFPQGPTGRFTNGKNVGDFIAEYLGLPYPPPFVAVGKILRLKWLTGFNYASGGCGILDQTGSTSGKCLNMDEQVQLFKDTINYKLKKVYRDPIHLFAYLSKSIFVINMGNNDYLGDYFNSNSNISRLYTPDRFASLLIHRFSRYLKKLYDLGARKIVVFEVLPHGCNPRVRTNIKQNRTCDEEKNHIISIYNGKLRQMLKSLQPSLSGSNFVQGRAYALSLDAILNPSKYGLENIKKPCCIILSSNSTLCTRELQPCKKPDKYYFWDGAHPTEAIYSTIASLCISSSEVCTPLNIQQLVQA